MAYKLKDGTRAVIYVGNTLIGYVTSLTIDTDKTIVDANELGNPLPVEQHVMSYKATISAEYFVDELVYSRFTDKVNNVVSQTAGRYDFKDKIEFVNYLLAGVDTFNITVYTIGGMSMAEFIESTQTMLQLKTELFTIKNCQQQRESIRIQQGQLITISSTFITTDPIINTAAGLSNDL